MRYENIFIIFFIRKSPMQDVLFLWSLVICNDIKKEENNKNDKTHIIVHNV